MFPLYYRMPPITPNPFRKVVTSLLVLNTLWSLFFIFLWMGGAFVFIIPSNRDPFLWHIGMGPAIICVSIVFIASFLPLIVALSAAGRFSRLAMGCCSCWISAILWIGVVGPYIVILLFFLPMPTTTTAALGFFWLYERSRSDQEKGMTPETLPRPQGAPPRIIREKSK